MSTMNTIGTDGPASGHILAIYGRALKICYFELSFALIINAMSLKPHFKSQVKDLDLILLHIPLQQKINDQ